MAAVGDGKARLPQTRGESADHSAHGARALGPVWVALVPLTRHRLQLVEDLRTAPSLDARARGELRQELPHD